MCYVWLHLEFKSSIDCIPHCIIKIGFRDAILIQLNFEFHWWICIGGNYPSEIWAIFFFSSEIESGFFSSELRDFVNSDPYGVGIFRGSMIEFLDLVCRNHV